MTVVYVVIPLLVVAAVVVLVTTGRSRQKETAKLLAERGEFARGIGGSEHLDASRTRPSFGYFPTEGHGEFPQPFDYAVEFVRGGTPVVAFEKRTRKHSPGGTSTSALSHESFVEVPAAHCPRLWIGPELLAVQNLELRSQIVPELAMGRHHKKLVVASPDAHFARSAVTPETLAWLVDRLGSWFRPVVLEHGTLRTNARPGDRLTAANILPTADLLIEFLELLPRHLR